MPTPHSVALSWDAFFNHLLPPLVCYYATAILVQLPNTQWLRVALTPVTVYLSFWAGTQVDLSVGHDTLTYLNQGLAVRMTLHLFHEIHSLPHFQVSLRCSLIPSSNMGPSNPTVQARSTSHKTGVTKRER